jgi:phage FluMu protein Com
MGEMFVDGNVLAGALQTVFAVDVTVARGRCASCGHTGALAEARVYAAAGLVARCAHCEAVLLRVVEAPDRTYLDLHGIALLEFSN